LILLNFSRNKGITRHLGINSVLIASFNLKQGLNPAPHFVARVSRLPIEAFYLIGQDRASDGRIAYNDDLERIALDPVGDRAAKHRLGFCVVVVFSGVMPAIRGGKS
jgi:hypothetical protein